MAGPASLVDPGKGSKNRVPTSSGLSAIRSRLSLHAAEPEAAAAIKLIQVEYEDLPVLTDPIEAMKPDAPRVHEEIGESNICVHYKIRKGDVKQGFAKADVIVESDYRTPVQEHAYLQPEAGLAYIDEAGRVTIACGGQWAHEDREQIAHALNMPDENIRVIYPAIGGAFGGREDMSVQIVLALAAWKLHSPVNHLVRRGRHRAANMQPFCVQSETTKDGKVIAMKMRLLAMGVYTVNKVLGNSATPPPAL
jgi:CO/xanthine dehydrogenase Mo-binding subunit